MDNLPVSFRVRTLLVAAAVVCLLPGLAMAQGCAMCGTVGKGAADPLVRGMFRSILVMVSMPFSLAGGVAGWFAYRVRRGESSETAEPGEQQQL